MGLMESGCTRQDFGRDVQPAIPNRTRCWAHVGSTFGAISDREALCTACPSNVGIGGEPVSSYRAMVVVLRKLHPHGGDRCGRKRCQVRACAGAQKRDLARSRMTMICPLPGSVDGWLGVEDETGPCNGVKGAVDAYDPPLEARVPRLDRCCLKQKVGYSRDTAPKNDYQEKDLD